MAEFDYSNPTHRKLRSYRTHALTARLFADSPAYRANADTWAYIAKAWEDLAAFKEHSNNSKSPIWPRH
jgi:hypothetical protein